ncbi:TPA: carbamate kinase [Klebsiella pneumoniae]|jgi:carbamate kinase|nr:carbamate kinase [Klebsiella pneumoniae]|tara:strand:- start:1302 stop:2264 length:963 start_codon:yes stop_codon:yes gene_type:complete
MRPNSVVKRSTVVAIGGNALLIEGQKGTIAEQIENALDMARQLAKMIKLGWRVIVTHGNGPQVGFIVLRSDRSADVLPRLPLDICVADSQGGIGYIVVDALQTAMTELGLDATATAVLTRCVVDTADPAFENPTKPIGPFMSQHEAEQHRDEDGWHIVEDAGRGYRRVVPSPKPTKVLELNAIKTLVSAGHLVVAAGGGGIPVAEIGDGFYKGVEAVIDKDLTSALLARELGADLLLISTGVHQISINFKKPDQRALEQMTLAEARKYMAEGQFPPGSMGPKVEAAMRFLEGGSRGKVLITSPESVIDALDGKTGTWMMA